MVLEPKHVVELYFYSCTIITYNIYLFMNIGFRFRVPYKQVLEFGRVHAERPHKLLYIWATSRNVIDSFYLFSHIFVSYTAHVFAIYVCFLGNASLNLSLFSAKGDMEIS